MENQSLKLNGALKLPLRKNNALIRSFFIILLFILTACPRNGDTAEFNYSSAPNEINDTVYLSYPWIKKFDVSNTIINRIKPPTGFIRIKQSETTFGFWLRHLPLKPGQPEVLLYNGKKKSNQNAHYTVLDIDVGTRDLQQCADAVMRLSAEFLLHEGMESAIMFNFTNGDNCKWNEWKKGVRPVISGNKVSWVKKATADDSYTNFKKYLETVYTYAGSASLEKELIGIGKEDILPGDVWIQGGSPGHAVIVLDVAIDKAGKKVFLIAQSYMPAQEIHILKNPSTPSLSPWFSVDEITTRLITPEWTFKSDQLKRFQ